jgi:hypothetical protein
MEDGIIENASTIIENGESRTSKRYTGGLLSSRK